MPQKMIRNVWMFAFKSILVTLVAKPPVHITLKQKSYPYTVSTNSNVLLSANFTYKLFMKSECSVVKSNTEFEFTDLHW